MTGRGDGVWRRACCWGVLFAGLNLAAPAYEPVLAQPHSPFQNQEVTKPEPRPARRAAPRKPAPPSAPAEAKDVPAEVPSTASDAPTTPAEAPAIPAQVPATTAEVPATEDNDVPAAAEATLAPPPLSNPVRDGSDPSAAKNPKIIAALEQCTELLDGLDLEYLHIKPIRRGACGTYAPIKLKSIGKNPAVAVSPPAIVNCTVAATLHKWFKTSVKPTAEALGTQVVKIKNAASYMCRNQYGRSDTKLSEHARANALDIKAFVLASGQTVPILGNWPYGYRPKRPHLADMPPPNPLRDHSSLPPAGNGTPGIKMLNKMPKDDQFSYELEELRKVATNPFFKPLFAAPVELIDPEDEEPEGPVPAGNLSRAEAKSFLKTIHGDACKIFWTVLGPEANAAHRDHFHLDMRKRRYVRICQ